MVTLWPNLALSLTPLIRLPVSVSDVSLSEVSSGVSVTSTLRVCRVSYATVVAITAFIHLMDRHKCGPSSIHKVTIKMRTRQNIILKQSDLTFLCERT